jgi:hypothetical protein
VLGCDDWGADVLGAQVGVKAICKDQVLDMADEHSYFGFFMDRLVAPFFVWSYGKVGTFG